MKNRMSAMSVFNGSWNDLATEKTAKDISTAIDKASQKITADGNKNAQKAIEVFKTSTDKITDAIGKIKPTNNATQPVPPNSAVEAVATGLDRLGTKALEMSEYLRCNPPTELDAVVQSVWTVEQQFSDLLASASLFDQSSKGLREATEEVAKGTTETGSSFPSEGGRIQSIPVGNSFGRLCDFS